MKKRLTYIDLTNIIAIFLVLLIHSSWYSVNSALGIFDNIIRGIAAIAVFLFLMNSGATLIDYRNKYSTKTFINKRIKRVFFPLLLWSVIFYFVDFFVKTPLPDVNYKITKLSFDSFIKAFFTEQINGAFWFFYLIIALYAVTPIISVLCKNHLNVLFYIVCLDFTINFGFMYLNNNWLHWNVTTYVLASTANSYIGFYVMGYLIKIGYFNQIHTRWLMILGVVSLIIIIIIAFFRFQIKNPLIYNLGEYSGPLNFFYTIGFYIVIKRMVENHHIFENSKVQKWLAVLSSLSLGIYILHPFFLKLFMKITHTQFGSWIDILCMPIFAYVLCGITVYLIKKVPLLKNIIP